MLRPIRQYPDRVLRRCAVPVAKVDDCLRQLVADMIETMRDHDGLGLAAPQVGESVRLFVMGKGKESDEVLVAINPVLEELADLIFVEEGCLSLPGKFARVKRARKVVFRYGDLDGKECRLTVEGDQARAVQHECDHLEGLLFIDRIPPAKREELLHSPPGKP